MKRVFAFPLVRLVLIVLLFAVLAAPVVLATRGARDIWTGVAMGWILSALLLAATALVERFTTGKSLASIGLAPRHAVGETLLGAFTGALLFSLVALELFIGGWYSVTAVHVTPSLAIAVPLFLGAAALEEILFRGVIFRLVEEWTGTWAALAVSAFLFGLSHAANPGATPLSSLAIALEAGILLGAAYVLTRNLWLPIGLHFAWNFFEGPVFGAQISGRAFLQNAVTAHVAGPSWITGGAFGPEAGVPAIITCVVAAIVILVRATRAREILQPSWRKAVAYE
jgi:uncharacterized protein